MVCSGSPFPGLWTANLFLSAPMVERVLWSMLGISKRKKSYSSVPYPCEQLTSPTSTSNHWDLGLQHMTWEMTEIQCS